MSNQRATYLGKAPEGMTAIELRQYCRALRTCLRRFVEWSQADPIQRLISPDDEFNFFRQKAQDLLDPSSLPSAPSSQDLTGPTFEALTHADPVAALRQPIMRETHTFP